MPKVKKKVSTVSVYKENHAYNYVLLASFAIFLIIFSTFKITGDDDFFWHLATGRFILQTHSVPSVDVFGYMTQGQQWMPFEWGWDVLTYTIYSFSGINGILILRTVLLLAVFFIYYTILKSFKISDFVIIFFLLYLSFAIIDRLSPRPHLMTYLFFSLILLIIIKYMYITRTNYKILFFIPPIFLLWANMHMGIIAGIFLLGVYVISEIIIYVKPVKFSSKEIPALSKKELIRLIIVFLLAIFAMFINPNFYQTYLYAYGHTKMKMLETVNEWVSPFSEKYNDNFVSLLYKILLFSGIVIIYYSVKTRDLFPALLYVFFAFYSIRAMRFTVDYVLLIIPFIAISFNFILKNVKSENVKNFINKTPPLKVLMICFLLFLSFTSYNNDLYLKYMKYYRITGLGIDSDFIPTSMFDFMKSNNIPLVGDKIFNHFGTGGFFIWNFPDKKNFIDSRNLNDDIFDKYNTIIGKRTGFEQKLEEYGIDYAIYLAPDLVRMPQEMEQTIISFFSKSQKWKLIFWDDKSFLFVKNLPKFKELIDRFEYKYLNPYNIVYNKQVLEKGFKEDTEIFKKEYYRKLNEEPNGIFINNTVKNYGNKLNN